MGYELYDIIALAVNPFAVFALIMRNGGLIVFFPLLLRMLWEFWHQYVMIIYTSNRKRMLLAIDVPRLNEQSMKAVEQIIGALHGTQFTPTFKEKYWQGLVSDSFALEIVSIDGYIQYFIRCDTYNEELVKGAIYAQYPDAEIVEVEDYVNNVPASFPDDEWDMFGGQFVLAKNSAYPIKTYEHFEHPLTGVYADPLAALLELFSRLKPGEQIWMQLILTAEGIHFNEKALHEVDNLIGRRAPSSPTFTDKALNAPIRTLQLFTDSILNREWTPVADTSTEGSDGNFLNMTTGEKAAVEEIQKKAARRHFGVNFRVIYLAKKDVMNSLRVVGSILGAVKQYNTLDLNSFVFSGDTLTAAPEWLFVKMRQTNRKNNILNAYKHRSNWSGSDRFVLSDAEIATIFHFPLDTTRAPLISKTESKKAEPPSRLPFDMEGSAAAGVGHVRNTVKKETPPAAITEVVDQDNTEVEDIQVPEQSEVGVPPSLPVASPAIESSTINENSITERVRAKLPSVVLKDTHGKILSEVNVSTENQVNAPQVEVADQKDYSHIAPPPVASQGKISSSVQLPPQPPETPYPLHSMPGLPPGVHPIDRSVELPERLPQPMIPAIPLQIPKSQQSQVPAQQSDNSAPPPNLPI